MTDPDPDAPVTVAAFHATPGVEDWRVLGNGLNARWRCASLAAAASFASAVAEATAESPVTPNLDLRARSVTAHMPERDDEFVRGAELVVARTVQRIAREAGLAPEPGSLRSIQIAVAAAPGVDVQPFWRAILGWSPINDTDAKDPHERGPRLWFHDIEHGRPGRGRTHIDVYLPADEVENVVHAALDAGGRIAAASNTPHWWSLASPDNHGVDVAAWPDR